MLGTSSVKRFRNRRRYEVVSDDRKVLPLDYSRGGSSFIGRRIAR